MLIILIIIFEIFLLTHEQNIDNFFLQEECLNFKIINLLESLFSTRQCLSFIYLSQDMYVPNEYFHFSNLPKVILRKNESTYKPEINMIHRPRRDFHTQYGTIAEFCEERDEGFILFSPNMKILHAYAFSDMITAFLNPRAYFFIIVSEPITPERVSPLIARLWYVYHVPIVRISCCTCNNLYMASPTAKNNIAVYELKETNVHKYINKKLYQMHGLPIKICMFPSVMAKKVVENGKTEFEGVDRMMVDLLAEKMNFTKIIVESPNDETYGRRKSDGNFSGSIGVLVSGNAEMVGVGFFAMDYQTRDIEPTQGVQVDDLCAVVHKAKEVPPWLAPVKYLGYQVCCALLMVYFGVAGVWIAIRRSQTPSTNPDTTLMFFNTIRLMLTTSIPNLSNTTCERLFLACCSAAFLTLVGTFQGSLVTVYSTQFFYKDINTLQDLAEAQLPLLTRFESFKKDIFTNESNVAREKLKDLVQIYNEKKPINDLIAEGGNIGGISRRSSIDLDADVLQYKDKNGNIIIHLVRECIRTYNIAYMLPRASALAHRINEIILRSSQAGLFEKWYRDMAVNNTKYLGKKQQTQGRNEDANVPLSVVDLQLAMYGFIIGMAVSLLVFIFENVWGFQLRCAVTRIT